MPTIDVTEPPCRFVDTSVRLCCYALISSMIRMHLAISLEDKASSVSSAVKRQFCVERVLLGGKIGFLMRKYRITDSR